MNLEKMIEQIFNTKDFLLENMEKGYTNKNFLLSMKDKQYVVRVPREDHNQIIKRRHETIAIKQIEGKDIDIPALYFDEETGIKITPYVDGLSEYETTTFEDKVERVAHLMKRFHDFKLTYEDEFDPIQKYYDYLSYVKKPFYDLAPFSYIIDEVKNYQSEHILCHNDVVSGNLLFSKHKTYLIDFEYAAGNDPLFDVMSFFSENQIFDSALRERFYHIYFDTMSEHDYQALKMWETFQNVLWCTWAMMMYESREEEIYQKIAHDKYQALLSKHK